METHKRYTLKIEYTDYLEDRTVQCYWFGISEVSDQYMMFTFSPVKHSKEPTPDLLINNKIIGTIELIKTEEIKID